MTEGALGSFSLCLLFLDTGLLAQGKSKEVIDSGTKSYLALHFFTFELFLWVTSEESWGCIAFELELELAACFLNFCLVRTSENEEGRLILLLFHFGGLLYSHPSPYCSSLLIF